MSAELHEMHALLQQLRELNEAHDLDHCEGKWMNKLYAGAAKVGNVATATAKAGGALVTGGTDGLAKHNSSVAAQKERDTAVLAKWGTITDVVQQRTVLKSAIDVADPKVVGPLFLANPATKDHFQTSVENYSAPVAA
jgi:hypothetical protein